MIKKHNMTMPDGTAVGYYSFRLGVDNIGRSVAPRYPLYCVDRTDRVDPETQYLGPFDTHDEADEKAEPGDLVRRCRQLRATEIDYDACRMAAYDLTTVDALVEDVDEVATSGNLPETAWHVIGDQIVFGRSATTTLPHPDEFKAWADSNLEIFAYVCEGDE